MATARQARVRAPFASVVDRAAAGNR